MIDAYAKVAALPWEQLIVLQGLDDQQWETPMGLGGYDGSPHSAWLAKFIRWGVAERRARSMTWGGRNSYEYRRTELGREACARLAQSDGVAPASQECEACAYQKLPPRRQRDET